MKDLVAWKAKCPDSSPDEFILPNKDGGFLDTGNYRRRVLKKLAETLNLPKLTFQIIRRSIATLSQTKGHVKSTQGLLRHARTPTTTEVYQQILPEGVREMVDSIHGELRKPGSEAEKTRKIAANLREEPASIGSEKRKIGANWSQNNFDQPRGWPIKSVIYR